MLSTPFRSLLKVRAKAALGRFIVVSHGVSIVVADTIGRAVAKPISIALPKKANRLLRGFGAITPGSVTGPAGAV
jgi:hypothetical protein